MASLKQQEEKSKETLQEYGGNQNGSVDLIFK